MQKKLFLLSFLLLLFTFGFSQKQVVNSNISNITWNTGSNVIHCSDFHATKPLIEIAAEHPIIENRETSFTEYPDKDGKPVQNFIYSVEKDGAKYGNDLGIVQSEYGKSLGKAPLQNWAGQAPSVSFRPFDPSGAAGPNHYIQMINATTYEIWDKTGTSLVTGTLGDLWTPTNTENSGDPIVLYDKAADRWFLSQFGQSGDKMYIAISQTNDPTGSWYAYTFSSPDFPDYLKFSVWQDGYYMTSNQSSQVIFAFNRDKMLVGDASAEAVYQTFTPPTPDGFFCPLPADASDGVLPTSGTPCPILSYSDDAWSGGAIDGVNIYNASVTWGGTPSMTVTSAGAIPTSAFDASYDTNWNDIEQPGTTQKLDGIGGALMYRAQWKTWSDHNSIVLSWGVKISATQRGVFWCELRQDQSTGNWSTYQDGIYAPGTSNCWMSSIVMNNVGDIALCYAKTDPANNVYASLGYAGRHASDPIGTLPIAEVIAKAGSGAQTGGNRNGDYSQACLDPDGFTFWHTGEYLSTGGTAMTQVFSFRISEPYDPMISATAVSTSQINIDYTLNDNNEPALIAWSADGTFGTPLDGTLYSNGDAIPGGGSVLVYSSADGTYNHTGLTGQTKYYYKAWSYKTDNTYSDGYEASATTLKEVPTNHVTNFTTGTPGGSSIPLTWTDAVGSVLPDGYIIKVSNVDFASITAPINGTDEADDNDLSDGSGSKKVSYGSETATFTGLNAVTTYYFKIYPYTNSGSYILYKTDGTVPEVSETTTIEYCASGATNSGDTEIQEVYFGNVSNITTGECGQYNDYTTDPALTDDFIIGSTNDIKIFLGNCTSGSYTKAGKVYIDWNYDGDFDDADEMVFATIAQDANWLAEGTFTVPPGTSSGQKFMRIVVSEDENNINPCGTYSYGETEDYSINILPACTPPVAQVTSLTIDAITLNTMDISWTSGTENVLILAQDGDAISTDPIPTYSYNADAAYGSGDAINSAFVVFNGVGENMTLTNLTPGHTYYFSAYTYAYADNCYNTDTPAIGNGTTQGPPSVVTGTISSVTQTSATAAGEVVSENGAPATERGIVYSLTTDPTTSDNKITDTNTGIGTYSADITGLTANTTYHVRAYAINSSGTAYGDDIVFKTACGIVSALPYTEDFATQTLPDCWENVDNDGSGQVWEFNNPGGITFNSTSSANGFAILDSDNYGTEGTQDASLETNTFDLSTYPSVNVSFEHYYRDWSYDEESATFSYSIDGGSNWIDYQVWEGTSSSNPELFNADFSSEVGGQSNVKFRWTYAGGSFSYYWAIDDIVITNAISVSDIEDTNINIYPNPSNGIFTLQNGTNNIKSFDVFNMSGKIILSRNINSDKTTIDLSNQAHGFYFIKMYSEDSVYNAKLIIK